MPSSRTCRFGRRTCGGQCAITSRSTTGSVRRRAVRAVRSSSSSITRPKTFRRREGQHDSGGPVMRIVVALGGNALLERGEKPDSKIQLHHIHAAVKALAPIAANNEVVITHGNGPQVGLLALESAGDLSLSRPYPFDVLGAETQGMIGYWLSQTLQNTLPDRSVAA